MSTIEIVSKIETLREWESLQAEAAAMVESLKDDIKKHMDSIGVESLEAGQYIARFHAARLHQGPGSEKAFDHLEDKKSCLFCIHEDLLFQCDFL